MSKLKLHVQDNLKLQKYLLVNTKQKSRTNPMVMKPWDYKQSVIFRVARFEEIVWFEK